MSNPKSLLILSSIIFSRSAAEGISEAKQWIDAIINDTDPLVMPEQAYKVTEILEAIYKSAETGNEIKFR